ncbi:desmoglein-2.1-like [Neoarius graeffei]|uniref:desmoglein-2.1-like n=1 Tax=Neoarius graeffei TaxID=443677 RepID=UPI00298CA48A|nr:desmoglein-2.1-like [Neoarius graeffei]XP_060773608.1 desmoglein-2.1-like [Neoarius graeffei]
MGQPWRSVPLLCLFCFIIWCVFEAGAKADHSVSLQRHRREWIIPPQILEENVDYTKKPFIARIMSDEAVEHKGVIRYSLKGIGADKPPYNLFVVNPSTGEVKVTGILDREEISQYNLSGVAVHADTSMAESDIQLTIKVKDQNDNPPIFLPIGTGSVYELSKRGTTVMKVTATDADEPGNINSQISYKIVDQNPPGEMMFDINQNGEVIVSNENLDREKVDQYKLTVRASDLNGNYSCNTATTTLTIQIKDVNDNIPVLEQDSFEVSVEENTENVEVMRLKPTDLDLPNTENWQAVYTIVSGNGGGHFDIVTDPKTNEGILMLVKSVDYEQVKLMKLGIIVSNVAQFYPGHKPSGIPGSTGMSVGGGGGGGGGGGSAGMSGGGGGGGKVYTMNVNVKNQPEGPAFNPKVKQIPVSENGKMVDIKKALTTYTAIDPDTGLPAHGVKYVKGSDRDNWLSIDEKTAEIKLNKIPDRESPYLVNGTYMAEILCISQDMPFKTATGTVAIQVEDFNDHCPTLPDPTQTMCTTQEVLYVTAVDDDDFPNAYPLTFIVLLEGTDGIWSVEHLNDTTAMLKPQDAPWPGPLQVTLEVRDQQGISCPDKQVLKVTVCTCDESATCGTIVAQGKSSELGSAGIGLLVLGLLMLLLIPLLLLLCQCGAAAMSGPFTEMPFDTKEHLISYYTEGQGEDWDVPFLSKIAGPRMMPGGFWAIDSAASGVAALGAAGDAGYIINGGQTRNQIEMASMSHGMNGYLGMMREEFSTYDSGLGLSEDFFNHYYSHKTQDLCTTAEENLLLFSLESQGSPAGSVGCCSILGSDNDLEFLNDLESKFTTLAEICGGGTKFTMAAASLPPPKPIMDHSESVSMHTSFANTNTVNMAAEVAASSTMHRAENVVVNDTHVVSDVQPAQTLIDVPTQILMAQQQPMYYMVEPQVSNTVLLAERPTVGMTQGMCVLNGAPVNERVLVQGAVPAQGTIGGGDGVVLLETYGESTTALNTDLLQSAHLLGSQLLLVDTGAQGGQVLQGILPQGNISGSQGIVFVEGQGGSAIHGSLQRSVPVTGGSRSMQYVVERQGGTSGITHGSLQRAVTSTAMSQNGTIGLNTSTVHGLPSSQKIVVKEKKVVKTNL